jgi:hypothetical protein
VVTELRAWSSQISTATGIHAGSTVAEVKAAYPQPNYVLHNKLTDLYVIDHGTGRMIIEVEGADGGDLTKATIGKVLWISVQSRSLKATSIANIDGTAGCGE